MTHTAGTRIRSDGQWLAATLRSMPDAVITADVRGRIRSINRAAVALTGWGSEEVVGRDLHEVFRVRDIMGQMPDECPITRIARDGLLDGLQDRVRLIDRGGREIPIEYSASCVQDDRGGVAGAVVVFRDVAERVEAEQALIGYATELRERNEDLQAFARTVAHDLKSPLSPLVCMAELLEQEHATMPAEDLGGFVASIAQIGRKMVRMVEELLLLAQVRANEVQTSPLEMSAIVTEARQRLSYMIEEYQADIRIPARWPRALGYRPWVEEIWVNYISNALKYGGRPPRLELGATPRTDGMVFFWVRDNGQGLAPDQRDQLFAPFTQLSDVRATGYGLGLSIVQHIAQKMGGRVEVDSEMGRGSVFGFTLPVAK